MDVGHQIHRLVGMEWLLAWVQLNLQAELLADRDDDVHQRDRESAANVEHIASGLHALLEDEANRFCYVLDGAEIADLRAS